MVTSVFDRPRFDLPDDALLAAAAVAAALFASANARGLPDKTFIGDIVAISLGFPRTLPFALGLAFFIDFDDGEGTGAERVGCATVCNGDDDGVSVNVVGSCFSELARIYSIDNCLPDN